MQQNSGFASQVYDELTKRPGDFLTIEALAERLNMSERTLRRKLDLEGTSYSQILMRVRHALALDYLTATRLKIVDIASALSFSDVGSFRHAFKKWTGLSPNEYREKVVRRHK